jgi:osmotically-inducible protein OsmY
MSKILLASLGMLLGLILNTAYAVYPGSSNQGTNPNIQNSSTYFQRSDSDQDQDNQRQDRDSNYNRNSDNSSYYTQTPRNNPSYNNQGQGNYQNNPNPNSNNLYNSNPNNVNSPEASNWNRSSRNQLGYTEKETTTKTSTLTLDNSKYPQDRGASETDQQLNAKIREKISGWFSDNYKNIILNTSNGNVNISGTVKNDEDLKSLLKEVHKVDGVRNVNSNVQIRESK